MNKAVLISIQPKWCKLIADGKKTVEVRKNKPKLQPPFKCYIYQTKALKPNISYSFKTWARNGKVIGEFVCDNADRFDVPYPAYSSKMDESIMKTSCLDYLTLHLYAKNKTLYAWHISDLKIYDKPKELREFKITRPPQSWCYV